MSNSENEQKLEFQHYVGTKIVEGARQDKDGSDGYAVRYPDGYLSWSPKDVFEQAYLPLGDLTETPPHVQRMVAEQAELDRKVGKLSAFLATQTFEALPEIDRELLRKQYAAMRQYSKVLGKRVERATAA